MRNILAMGAAHRYIGNFFKALKVCNILGVGAAFTF